MGNFKELRAAMHFFEKYLSNMNKKVDEKCLILYKVKTRLSHVQH